MGAALCRSLLLILIEVIQIKEDILNAIKNILGLTNSNLDELIGYSMSRAELAILAYTGWNTIEEKYVPAWIGLSIAYFNQSKYQADIANGKQIKASQTQGSRSESYVHTVKTIDSDGLTEDVRLMLPLPRLKVF